MEGVNGEMSGYADLMAKRARLLTEAAQLYDLAALNWDLVAEGLNDTAGYLEECAERLNAILPG